MLTMFYFEVILPLAVNVFVISTFGQLLYPYPFPSSCGKSMSIKDKVDLADRIAQETDIKNLLQLKWERNKKLFTDGNLNPPSNETSNVTYHEMIDFFKTLANDSGRVTLLEIGNTIHGFPIFALKIALQENFTKPLVLVDSGIYANEMDHIAVTSAFINLLISTDVWDWFIVDWLIVCIVNPDGFHYVGQTHDLFWVKNMAPVQHPNCIGVNLNRNFMYQWFPGYCTGIYDTVYPGSVPADQFETKALQDLMLNHTHLPNSRLKVYISFHGRGNNVLYPLCFHPDVPEHFDKVENMAKTVCDAIGAGFVAKQCSHVMTAQGVNIDFAYGIGIPYAFIWNIPKVLDTNFTGRVYNGLLTMLNNLKDEYNLTRSNGN